MTDFYRSLDRALDPEHPYAWAPPADTGIVDGFRANILASGHQPEPTLIQKSLAALGLGVVQRFVAGVDPDDPAAYDGFGAPLYAHQIPAEGTE